MSANGRDRSPRRVAKVCGADVEVGNFILGRPGDDDTGPEASRAVLRQIDGVPSDRYAAYAYGSAYGGWGPVPSAWRDPQDVERRYLTNAGCAYIDQDHLELCVPEVRSAYDHVAAWHAMLRIAGRALAAANARRLAGERIQVLVNNSDGRSHSYGSHCNFLVTRRAWDNLFHRKLHHQLFLAACQVSALVLTGQGKVGAENGAPPAAFQIAQRADFFATLCAIQTTYDRPLVNARDESLCGGRETGLARLHCIYFDNTLCHVATLLKIGIMQIVLAMIECERVDTRLLLDDPLSAVRRWSRDPSLRARARLLSGREVTAVELQQGFFAAARRFADAGGCEDVVPRATEILDLWEDTLGKLAARDFDALAARLDWVLKYRTLQRVLVRRRDLHWGSPAIKHLDHLYSSLDAAEGLYWAFERDGVVERVVDDARIEHFVANAPDDTRAWTRAVLLQLAGDAAVRVDWDAITFEVAASGERRRRVVLPLDSPLRFTKRELERRCRPARTLAQLLAALGAEEAGNR
jgi:proteasome accessory factor A